jgi:putative flippase GtrA
MVTGTLARWLKFNLVGMIGFAVQSVALVLLVKGTRLDPVEAAPLAVEIAVLHNFFWRSRFTWRTRGDVGMARRLILFHAGNGMVSLAGNAFLIWLLVDLGRAPLLLANCAAVALCSVVNFIIGDRIVFRLSRCTVGGRFD